MEAELVMSRHALEQARERGISINEIRDTTRLGAKYLQDGKIVAAYRHVQVAFRKLREKILVITVMIRK